MRLCVEEMALPSEGEGTDVTGFDVQWAALIYQRVTQACASLDYDLETIRQEWFQMNGPQISVSYSQARLGFCASAEVDRSKNSITIKVE